MHQVKMNHEKEVHARRVSIAQKFMAVRMHLEVYSDPCTLVTEFEQYRNSVKDECQVQMDTVVRGQKNNNANNDKTSDNNTDNNTDNTNT